MEATSLMGYVEIVKDGVMTRIDGDLVTHEYVGQLIWCDDCETYQPASGGFEVRDSSRESVLWLCAKCRK
jgi:hypothetical protein